MTLDIYQAGNANAQTKLSAAYVAGITTTITVANASVLPPAPNIVTVADAGDPANKYVVVVYAGKTGTSLTGLTVKSGYPNSSQAFAANDIVRRNISGVEWNAMKATLDNLGTAAELDAPGSDDDAAADEVVKGNDTRLTNPRVPTTHAGTHAAGGADPLTLSAPQITSGRFAIDRLTQNITPIPSFTWARVENDIQNTIQFTDASTTIAGTTIVSRRWDFGDGNTSGDQNPIHTFPAFGTYTVSLAVKNEYGTTTAVSSVTVATDPIYGMRIIDAQSIPNSKIEYIDNSVGKTPVYYDSAVGAWSMGDWGDVIDSCLAPCVLPTGATAPTYLNAENLALYADGTASPLDLVNGTVADGDIMVECKGLRFVQISRDGNDILVRFCSSQPDLTYHPFAHQFGSEVRKTTYAGMFEGLVESDTLKSIYSLSATPTPSRTMDSYRNCTASSKKGAATYGIVNMHLDDWHTLLSMMWLRTTNFQGTVGNGNSSSDVYLKTGETLNLTGGCIQGDTVATNNGVMLFWVWNKYGNYWEVRDGFVKRLNGVYWVCNNNRDYIVNSAIPSVAPDNYDVCHIQTPAPGFIHRLAGDVRCPLIPTATGSGASSTTDYCDYFYTSADADCMLLRGGTRSRGADDGPFSSNVSCSVGYSGAGIVARLQAFLAAE